MAVETYWVCDGCDQRLKLKETGAGEWRQVSVRMEGFAGPPTYASKPVMDFSYHLCPKCQQRLWDSARPRKWERNQVGMAP